MPLEVRTLMYYERLKVDSILNTSYSIIAIIMPLHCAVLVMRGELGELSNCLSSSDSCGISQVILTLGEVAQLGIYTLRISKCVGMAWQPSGTPRG